MKNTVEVFWFSEQAYGHVTDSDLEKYDSGRLGFPNSFFDPEKAHVLYNQYHEQYALADEMGFDGIMSNEHHSSYWCMKPAVNLDAAVISKITKNTKIAILGNVIAVNDPIRMAEEIAMLWFPGLSSQESVVWAAKHQHPYMNLGSLLEYTEFLKGVYIDTAKETGFQPGPEHFGYLLRVLCADTDEEAQRIGNHFQWTEDHRNKGPREHNDPPGYQSREAVRLQRQLPGVGRFGKRMSYQELQDADNVIVGSPKTVTEKLSRIIGRLNPGYLHIYGNEGDMPHEASMRSIELLGKEVIPALHEIQLKPYED